MIFRPNASGGIQGKYYFPKTLDDIIDTKEEGFGEAHIRWAAASMRLAAREGDRLLQLLQGLHVSEGFEPLSRLPSNMLFLFGNPKDHIEAETIRNVFWV
ncbi:hypothetical protein FRC00_003800 [Tulasnella sp. 408]|nr:hypothetical protein FRC00_003800 [Tulasnella sp. 408]